MNAIQLMVDEHKNIKRVLTVVRKLCIEIVNGEEIKYEAFEMAVDFVRNYADKHHHNKEEAILFKKMEEELKEQIGSGPILGMYAEHDLGRMFIGNLVNALERVKTGEKDSRVDVIANAIAYTDLLHRHIDKEDNVIYKFGETKLSSEALREVEEKCKAVEDKASENKIQDKYIKIVERLESMV